MYFSCISNGMFSLVFFKISSRCLLRSVSI